MTEHWIIDASPLILLGKAGQLDWLLQMGRIVVPESVAAEVVAGAADDPARRWLEAPQGAASIVRDDAPTNDLLAWDLGREWPCLRLCVSCGEAWLSDGSRVLGIGLCRYKAA